MSKLDTYPPLHDIDKFQEKNHSMVLYDNEKYGDLVKYYFIENGLKNNENSVCLTHGGVDKVEDEMTSFGIDIDHFKRKKLLHIYQIENIMERKDGYIAGFNDMVKTISADFNQPQRIVGRCINDVSSKEGIEAELVIEHLFHSHFNKYNCSFLCPYAVNDIEGSNRPKWLNELFKNHHHMIYATDPAQAVTFDPELLTNFDSSRLQS